MDLWVCQHWSPEVHSVSARLGFSTLHVESCLRFILAAVCKPLKSENALNWPSSSAILVYGSMLRVVKIWGHSRYACQKAAQGGNRVQKGRLF